MEEDIHKNKRNLQVNVFLVYLKNYLCFITLIFFVLAFINFIVDPKGYFNVFLLTGFNKIKYSADGGRIEKSIRLKSGNYNTLVAGTSRVQVGIDPNYPALKHHNVYNLGLSGTNLYELEKVLNYAIKYQNIKLLIWGLDFLTFSTQRKTAGDFESSYFKNEKNIEWIFDYLINTYNLLRSLKVIFYNYKNKSDVFSNERGFFDKSNMNVNHRELFTSILTENFLVNNETYAGFQYGKDRLQSFKRVLKKYSSKNIKIILFISPVHARQLEALNALNLFDDFEDWKRDVVYSVEDINEQAENRIVLWDFSGYNSITMERIPDRKEEQMRWYWESSHYKKEVGNLIVERILKGQSAESVPDDFGVMINPHNIEQHLLSIREDRKWYARTFMKEIKDVEYLTIVTSNQRAHAKLNRDNTF